MHILQIIRIIDRMFGLFFPNTCKVENGAVRGMHSSRPSNLFLAAVKMGPCVLFSIGFADSEIRMVDGIHNLAFFDKMGHGTTLGRPFGAFRVPTKNE